MSHTPGPWMRSGNRIRKDMDGKPGYGIVDLFADGPQPEWQDNLKLIAAAPDLLKALQFYANPDNWWRDYSQSYLAGAEGGEPSISETDGGELAREAIRKALGDYKAV